jgi:hypothetical protein
MNVKLGLSVNSLSFLTISIVVLISLMAFLFVYYIYQWLFNYVNSFVKDFIGSLDRTEKLYLILSSVIISLVIIVLFQLTNIFSNPTTIQGWGLTDVLFTTDSHLLNKLDVYLSINALENDIRQPLFGLFSLPIAILAKMFSQILFFVPNAYLIFLSIFQLFILQISVVLLVKLINPNIKHKLILFLFINSTFSYMLFSIVMEQYILSVFWIIFFVYSYIEKRKTDTLSYIGATGSMVTSGILLGINFLSRDIKFIFKQTFKLLVSFLAVISISGQLPIVINSFVSIPYLMRFAGGSIPFIDRVYQYLSFIVSSYTFPTSEIVITELVVYRYHLTPINQLNIYGILIIMFYCVSFYLNRSNTLIKIAFSWFIYSFLLLCVIGWGTTENGLVLYQLYFSWAFIILFYKGLSVLFISHERLLLFILIISTIILLFVNVSSLYNVIQFGIKYYPN